jgi:hypothetical protein
MVRNTPLILLAIAMQEAHGISTDLTRGNTMGVVVKQVEQLDNHTNIPCHLNWSLLLFKGRDQYVYFDGREGRRCVSFNYTVEKTQQKHNIFSSQISISTFLPDS